MICEGIVTLKQDVRELQVKNHITTAAAKVLLRTILLSTIHATGSRWANVNIYFYLMRTFNIRLGSGGTQIPGGAVSAMQTECVTMGTPTIRISGDYNASAPFDIVYNSQLPSIELCSAFAGVTISTIIQDVIAIQSDPPALPVTGDTYIVASPATGDWTGNETKVATYNGATWDFVTPDTSYAASVTGTPRVPYRFDGTSWIEIVNRCREMGLFTYGYVDSDASPLNVIHDDISGNFYHGNEFLLAAYISANGGTPDFDAGSIDICKPLAVEWTIRISFAGDG